MPAALLPLKEREAQVVRSALRIYAITTKWRIEQHKTHPQLRGADTDNTVAWLKDDLRITSALEKLLNEEGK